MSSIQSVSGNVSQPYESAGAQAQGLSPFSQLDLTSAQSNQIRSIFAQAKQNGTPQSQVQSQIAAVLTPTQLQALQNGSRSGGSHHGGHHHHRSSGAGSASAPSSSADATSSASPSDTILATITNIQNQVVAAKAVSDSTLQDQVLAQQNSTS